MAFRILNKENQQVYLGTGQVFGVQSIVGQYQIPEVPLEFIGFKDSIPIPRGQQVGEISFDVLAIDTDPFIKCVQSGSFNGYILPDTGNINDNYSFTSGYLKSYNNSCTIGEIPHVKATFDVVGNLGEIQTEDFPADAIAELDYIRENHKETPDFNISAATSAEIVLDDFETNLVSSYNVTIELPRQNYYSIGSRQPREVRVDFPVIATCSFTIEVNDYSGNTMRSYPCTQKLKNIDIKLKNYQTNAILTQFSFKDAVLIGEAYSVNVEDNVKISATYRSYISRLDTLNNNLNVPELSTTTN
jgi:hypothetical protein